MLSGLDSLLAHSLEMIETKYVNYDYVNRPKGIFDELINDAKYKVIQCSQVWLNTAITGILLMKENSGRVTRTWKTELKTGSALQSSLRSWLSDVQWVIRSGKMIGGKVGILKVTDREYAKCASIK